VFGELYFALEYRDVAIRLQYSPGEPFTLPENLFFIGTMNTSDRSIALVDAAMRRRFYFVRLAPGEEPIKGLLARWLGDTGRPPLAGRLLDQLNLLIDDPEAAIGPSYFMSSNADSETGLRKVWRRSIIPLLEEHYLGSGRDVDGEFGYDTVASQIDRSP
jgi:5-methylcytosine-specific restriction protein B